MSLFDKPQSLPQFMDPKNSRSYETLLSFVTYCEQNPEQRFWQALRNWSGYHYILTSDVPLYKVNNETPLRDTFYLEGKRHDEES
jgi:hypothetical protein